jgi:hypothetical protein
MYFTIKYKVFYKYIKNATATAIHTCKKSYLTLVKGGYFFLFTLVTQQGRALYIFST